MPGPGAHTTTGEDAAARARHVSSVVDQSSLWLLAKPWGGGSPFSQVHSPVRSFEKEMEGKGSSKQPSPGRSLGTGSWRASGGPCRALGILQPMTLWKETWTTAFSSIFTLNFAAAPSDALLNKKSEAQHCHWAASPRLRTGTSPYQGRDSGHHLQFFCDCC